MATTEERIIKAEHDARVANYIASQAAGVQDFNIMMGILVDPRPTEEAEINE